MTLVKGVETPEQTREHAFELWVTVALQNYAETARLSGINEDTLRSWGRRYGWRAQALERTLDIAPEEFRHATGSIQHAAALDGATYLSHVVRGEVEPNRARQQAAIATLHMAGWAPAHYLPTRQTTSSAKPPRELPDLNSMIPDELLQLERDLTAAE
jgi:transposase-like protein